MGAANRTGFSETRQKTCCTCCGGNASNGIAAFGGLLLPNESKKLGDCTDGTSNTLLLGETSDWAMDPSNNNARKHIDPGYPHGWLMGGDPPARERAMAGNGPST